MFDGLDTSLPGVFSITGEKDTEGTTDALVTAHKLVEKAISRFDYLRPIGVVPFLTQGLSALKEALAVLPNDSEAAFTLRRKEHQFEQSITTATGLSCAAIALPAGSTDESPHWSIP